MKTGDMVTLLGWHRHPLRAEPHSHFERSKSMLRDGEVALVLETSEAGKNRDAKVLSHEGVGWIYEKFLEVVSAAGEERMT